MYWSFLASRKPMVAAVEGMAFGGGLEIALVRVIPPPPSLSSTYLLVTCHLYTAALLSCILYSIGAAVPVPVFILKFMGYMF